MRTIRSTHSNQAGRLSTVPLLTSCCCLCAVLCCRCVDSWHCRPVCAGRHEPHTHHTATRPPHLQPTVCQHWSRQQVAGVTTVLRDQDTYEADVTKRSRSWCQGTRSSCSQGCLTHVIVPGALSVKGPLLMSNPLMTVCFCWCARVVACHHAYLAA